MSAASVPTAATTGDTADAKPDTKEQEVKAIAGDAIRRHV
jgi:hypothetical protein